MAPSALPGNESAPSPPAAAASGSVGPIAPAACHQSSNGTDPPRATAAPAPRAPGGRPRDRGPPVERAGRPPAGGGGGACPAVGAGGVGGGGGWRVLPRWWCGEKGHLPKKNGKASRPPPQPAGAAAML